MLKKEIRFFKMNIGILIFFWGGFLRHILHVCNIYEKLGLLGWLCKLAKSDQQDHQRLLHHLLLVTITIISFIIINIILLCHFFVRFRCLFVQLVPCVTLVNIVQNLSNFCHIVDTFGNHSFTFLSHVSYLCHIGKHIATFVIFLSHCCPIGKHIATFVIFLSHCCHIW